MNGIPTTWAEANPALTQRVKEAVTPGKPLSTAIRDAAARLVIQIGWHEADVLAEALSHHHDGTLWAYQVIHSRMYPEAVDSARRWLLLELLETVHAQGMSLVEEPVETVHLVSDLPSLTDPDANLTSRKSPPMSLEDAKRLAVHQHLGYIPILVLTGKCRKLAKAT